MTLERDYTAGMARIDYVRLLLNHGEKLAEPRTLEDVDSPETREALLEEFFAYYAPALDEALEALRSYRGNDLPEFRESVIQDVAVRLRLQAPKHDRKRLNQERKAGKIVAHYLGQLHDRAGIALIRHSTGRLASKDFPNLPMWEAALATAKEFSYSDDYSNVKDVIKRAASKLGGRVPLPRGNMPPKNERQ